MSARENLILKTMKDLLGEDRTKTISYLMRIFACPGGEAVIKLRISTEILGSTSRDFLVDLAKGRSDLFAQGGEDRNQKEKLTAALAAARLKAANDDIMIGMIDAVDVNLLCAPDSTKSAELRARALTKIETA